MRILVVSDTHGDLSRFWKVFEKLKSEAPVQMIVHCGDYYEDAAAIRRKSGIPVTAVKGNCDGDFSPCGGCVLETEGGNLLVTHGHMENVGFDLQRLYYKAIESECIGALFGHTHRSAYVDIDGIYLMNPGSLSRPRDGSGGTFGILETSESGVWGKIYRYEDFTADIKSSAGRGEKIKSNNNSDNSKNRESCENGREGKEACRSKSGGGGTNGSGDRAKDASSEAGNSSQEGNRDNGRRNNGNKGGGSKPKVTGGHLRSLLNYSDRF